MSIDFDAVERQAHGIVPACSVPALPPTGRNVGHGHVFPRADGVRARCGGPFICRECARDAARKQCGQAG
jgi:hypothetical protein